MRDLDNNIIVSYSNLRNILPPQLNNMTDRYKVICGCECFILVKSLNLYLLTWCDFNLKQLKDKIHNAQNRRSGEISSHIFETYNDSLRPHG